MAGAPTAWGIDVGVTSLKAIKLRRDGGGGAGGQVAVEAFEVIEHDKFLSEPDIDRDATIRMTLEKFLSHHPLRREHVFISVPGSSTFARFVKLPPVEPKKVPEIVRFEAIQQIPFPLDQVNWDYHTFQSPESPDVEVGIFAMKKELVAQVLSNFRALSITVHGVQMSPLAIYNAAAYDGLTDDKGTVLIDMGAEHTDLVIMDQGRLWLRTINIGGNHFTDALAKSFKQSSHRAESLKKQAATSKYQKQIFQAMHPVFADLVAEIQRSIGHYNSSHRDSKLERIVGMGNPFKLPNLQKYLQQELKLEVIRLDGFRKVKLDGKLAASFNENSLGMAAAYGLAVQGLGYAPIKTNLLPTEIARAMAWRKKQPWFIGSAALVGLAVAAVGAYVWNERSTFAASQNATDPQSQFVKNNAVMAEAAQLKNEWATKVNQGQFDTDKAQADQMLNLAQARKVWPALSMDIYRSLPQAHPASTSDASSATQPAASQPADRIIVLTQIASDYYGSLATVSTTGAAVAAPTVTGPNPDDTSGNTDQTNGGAVASTASPTAASSATEGPSDHGFLVTISGYCPASANVDPADIAQHYAESLMDRAPLAKAANSTTSYYFTDLTLSGLPIAPPLPGTATPTGAGSNTGIWAKTHGPFFDVYALELAGVKPDATPKITGPGDTSASTPNPILQGDFGGPIDAYFRNPDTGIQYMYNDYNFTIQFKVHVK